MIDVRPEQSVTLLILVVDDEPDVENFSVVEFVAGGHMQRRVFITLLGGARYGR